MTVCERSDNILKERGMSRRKLAERAGIPPSSLQSALSRNSGLSLDMLHPISKVLEVPIEFLMADDQAEQTSDPEELVYKRYVINQICDRCIHLNEFGLQKVLERIDELAQLNKYTYTIKKE